MAAITFSLKSESETMMEQPRRRRRLINSCLRLGGVWVGKTFGWRTQSVLRSLGFAKPNEICHVPKAAARQRRGMRP